MSKKQYEIYYWIIVILFLLIAIPLQFYWPLVAPIRLTKELPVATPGSITSDVWSWSFVREGMYAFIYVITLSGLFMISTHTRMGYIIHIVVLVLFLAWFLVMLGFDMRDIHYGQAGPESVNFNPTNPARDLDWCCLFGLHPSVARLCANTNLCAFDGVFDTNPNFIFRVAMNGALIVFVLGDLLYTTCVWGRIINEVDPEGGGEVYEEIIGAEMMIKKKKRRGRV